MNVGILGGGQLARMLALAGAPLDIRCRVLEPGANPPAACVAEHIRGDYEDYGSLGIFAADLDAVTFEFENVSLMAATWLAERLPVYPPPAALAAAQERFAEKQFFERIGIPTPPFKAADNREQFDSALSQIGLPAVVKTRRFGYDGKGQAVLRNRADVELAWQKLGDLPLIVERFVSFERELSILAVRGRDGETRFYPLVQNSHRDGMLRLSLAPGPNLAHGMQSQAEDYARRAMEALNYVGVLAIEFFETNGKLLANEMAPRVHNSGHWTIEGAETSQFENHLRAVAGLPLGETGAIGNSAMINLIGTLPDPAAILAVPGAHLHLYGKTARPNRKLGHITLRANDVETLAERLSRLPQEELAKVDL